METWDRTNQQSAIFALRVEYEFVMKAIVPEVGPTMYRTRLRTLVSVAEKRRDESESRLAAILEA